MFRGNESRNLTDLAALVLKCPSPSSSKEDSIPLPESCAIASGSQIQSIVTTSGFLDPGRYAILPLAFNHWLHHSHQEDKRSPPADAESSDTHTRKRIASENDCGTKSVPYVVALHTGREVYYREHVSTRPGFLAESLFLLMKTNGKRSSVSLVCTLECLLTSMVQVAIQIMLLLLLFNMQCWLKLDTSVAV